MADKKTSLSPAKNIFKDQRVLLAIVIALIVVIISCINPNFIGINNIVAIFQQICVLGILTMAMSILLISGGIDLSIGNIMVVCGVVMYGWTTVCPPLSLCWLALLPVQPVVCSTALSLQKVSAFRWSLHWAPVRCFMALP